jgi:DNA-binding MarR family transcriptional regulator
MRTKIIRTRQSSSRVAIRDGKAELAEDRPSTSVLQLLHRASQCAEQLFAAEISGLDITPRQFAVLAKIDELGPASQIGLVEHSGIDRSTMADVVRRVVMKGLVQRRRKKNDSRAYELALTAEGRAVLDRAKPIASRVDRQLLSVLPSDSVDDFLAKLALIVQGRRAPTQV